MNNFDHAIEATNTALNSAGSAATENARYMESLNAKTNQLRATFQELANRVIDSELVGALLGLANAFLQLLNNPIGAFVVQVTLLTTALYGFIKLMQAMQIVDKVSGSIKSLIGIIKNFTGSLSGATTQIGATNASLSTLGGTLGIVGAAFTAVMLIAGEVKSSLSEQVNKVSELTTKLSELNSQLESYKTNSEVDETQIAILEKQIALTEKQLKLEAERKLEATYGEESAFSGIESYFISKTSKDFLSKWLVGLFLPEELMPYIDMESSELQKTGYERAQDYIKAYQATSNQLKIVRNQMLELDTTTEEGQNTFEELRQKESEYQESLLTQEEQILSVADELKNYEDVLGELPPEYQELLYILLDVIGANELLSESNDNLSNSQKQAPQTVDDMVNAYNALSDALDSYNQYGSLLEDNINNLNSYIPGLVDAIYDENGALNGTAVSAFEAATSVRELAAALMELRIQSATEAVLSAKQQFLQTKDTADRATYLAAVGEWNAAKELEYQLLNMSFGETSATGGGGGGGTQTDAVLEAHKSLVELLESELQLLEDQGASEEERIAKIKEIQDALHAQAEYLRSIGAEQAEINALSSEWWSYQQQIVDILEEQADKYEIAIDYMTGLIDDEISALEEQKAAIQAQNDELNEQIQLEEALDALAQARQKKTLVYKDGRFQYVEDIDEVSSAQENLDQIRQEQALQDRLDAIDEEIDAWEKYKEEWQNVVDSYTDNQNRLIAEEILGTNLENVNWQNRLSNLQVFAAQYAALMAQIANASAGGMGGGAGPGTATLPDGSVVSVDIVNGKTQNTLPIGSIVHTQGGSYQITGGTAGNYTSEKVNSYATGTLNSRPGMSLVGENGPELRIMDEGAGIIPAQITKNLWQWGALNPNSVLSNKFSNQNKSFEVTIQNLNLPNVKDGMEFVNYMKNNFWRKTMQFQLS